MNVLLIPYLKAQNVNALSSPYTIGFPAITGWHGMVHALNRKLGLDRVKFNRIGVVSHKLNVKRTKGPGDFVYSLNGAGYPLNRKGKRPSIVEKAICNITASIVIEYDDCVDDMDLCAEVNNVLLSMRCVGGDILKYAAPKTYLINDEHSYQRLVHRLMPGHCLIEKRDLMLSHLLNGRDVIDSLLDHLVINTSYRMEEGWVSSRYMDGWIVPIPVGYQGISDIVKAADQRDTGVPHRFAESILTLGEFVMPYRIKRIEDMLWSQEYDEEKQLYLCTNQNLARSKSNG